MADGRVVLVIGGGTAAKRAIAQAFEAGGDRVVVEGAADTTEAVEAAFSGLEEKIGPAEIVVMVAPEGTAGGFADAVDAGLTGAYRVARRGAQKMLRARKGRIVLVAPTAVTGSTGDAAAKAALIGFGRTLAREIGKRSITVNVVAPGIVGDAAGHEDLVAISPLARPVTAEEVAAAVVFLASEGAAAITGAVLPVDAGLVMGA